MDHSHLIIQAKSGVNNVYTSKVLHVWTEPSVQVVVQSVHSSSSVECGATHDVESGAKTNIKRQRFQVLIPKELRANPQTSGAHLTIDISKRNDAVQ